MAYPLRVKQVRPDGSAYFVHVPYEEIHLYRESMAGGKISEPDPFGILKSAPEGWVDEEALAKTGYEIVTSLRVKMHPNDIRR